MSVLDELLVELGYEYDPEDLEQFEKDLDKTTDLVKKFAAAIVGGTAALLGFTAATTSASDNQGKLADQIGISVESLDALQFANIRTGGTADGLSGSLEQLSIRIGETARGVGSGIEAFGLLGISVTDTQGKLKSADNVLLEVAKNFETLSKSQQIELADKLGLRESIKLLQQGKGSIEDLVAEARQLGVTTDEDAMVSAEFQDSLTDVWQITKQLSRVLTRTLAPALNNIANSVTDWWITNRELIEQNIPDFIEKTTFALKLLTLGAVAFIGVRLVSTVASLITLFRALTISTVLFNAAVAAIPLLIGTIIAGVALLAEDAKVFFEGGESFIGKMIEKYPQWAGELQTVAAIFATIADLTTMIFSGWGMIFDLFTSGHLGEDLKLVFAQIQRDISSFIDGVILDIKSFFTDLQGEIAKALDLGNIKDTVFNFFTGDDEKDVSVTNVNENNITVPNADVNMDLTATSESPVVEYMPSNVNVEAPIVEYMPAELHIGAPELVFRDSESGGEIVEGDTSIDNSSISSSEITENNSSDSLLETTENNTRNNSSVDSRINNMRSSNIDNRRSNSNVNSRINNMQTSNASEDNRTYNSLDSSHQNITNPADIKNLISIPEMVTNPKNDTQKIVVNIAEQGRNITEGKPDAANVVPNQRNLTEGDVSNTTTSDNSVKLEGDININVDGSSNPEDTAIAVRREIAELVEQTSISSNSAVRI